jgi:protoporphyrinogen/coproporphyrinogen III oxidase
MMNQNTYAVVGSGASGIAATYYLRKHGFNVELIEQDDAIGGRIRPFLLGKRSVQLGGKNIGRTYHLFREFTAAMGNNPYEFFGLNSSQVRNNKLFTLDNSRRVKATLEFMSQGTLSDIWRFWNTCGAVMRNIQNGLLGGPYFTDFCHRFRDRTLSEYFSHKFCQVVVRPMTVRMNGAEPEETYVGNFGSNLRMVLDTYDQLAQGMRPVLEQFSRTGPVRLNSCVESLLVREGRIIGLRLRDSSGVRDIEYAGVIIATPASVTSKIVTDRSPALSKTLDSVNYYPVTVVVAEYARDVFSKKVRALVFDDSHPISNAGAYGIDERNVVRYTFSGRTARRYMKDGATPEELIRIAEEFLNKHIPVSESDRIRYVAKYHPVGLCAYTSNYPRFAFDLQSHLAQLPGLYLTGDYIKGASLEACFQAGLVCAEQVIQSQELRNSVTPKLSAVEA